MVALSLLTVVPAPLVEFDAAGRARAVDLFPAVGLALGAMLGGLGLLLDRVLPGGPIAALLLVAAAVLTGGLHFDGLMDTADGVFGGRAPARRLEIMRDSRVGAFGATAGALALLAQYACLAELSGVGRLAALVVALTAGRWAMAVVLVLFPAARPDGLGASFRIAGFRWQLVVAGAITLAVAAATGPLGLIGVALATAAALVGGRYLARRLGGLTGDTYGALAVVAETVVLYTAVALRPT
ncbi:MAG TPA: adenosylcobinamide-GDP ribazoletransferase [Chloroflexota bacterium]|jgi:adenosylcobinamide-GDP ribazoletransferase|nr:adenosylcobinamide-GDP ribazoletransferase [Chloroflexota bacterium]